MHSPFVFNLYNEVIKNNKYFYAFDKIQNHRKHLLKQNQNLFIEDFGAGSFYTSSKKRKINNILKESCKSAKYGKLLFKLVNYFQPEVIIELGTSLGISTAYIASACKKSKIYTIEADKNLASLAKLNFYRLNLPNIEVINNQFDHAFPYLIDKINQIDLLFVDGNHKYHSTLQYYEMALPKIHENSILIFDDIYWSNEMKKAWEDIKNKKEVSLTIDLFWMGIVFFHKNRVVQHFKF